MTAHIISVHADNNGIPVIRLKGAWLKEAGFKANDKIAVVVDYLGELTILNMDIKMNKLLEQEFENLIIAENAD